MDEALEQAIDLRNQYTRVGYGGAPFEAFCDSVLPGFLAAFDRALARSAAAAAGAGAGSGHGGWLAPGAGPSIADFVLGEVLDGVTTMVAELGAAAGRETDALKPYPAVAAYKQRFDALVAPAREGAMTRPFNNKVAVWK